jgi:hypothetical protein
MLLVAFMIEVAGVAALGWATWEFVSHAAIGESLLFALIGMANVFLGLFLAIAPAIASGKCVRVGRIVFTVLIALVCLIIVMTRLAIFLAERH